MLLHFLLTLQLIEYVDKDNTADLDDYKRPNSTWFGSYDLSMASWDSVTFDNTSRNVIFTANNDSQTVLPFLTNGSLSLKAIHLVFLNIEHLCTASQKMPLFP